MPDPAARDTVPGPPRDPSPYVELDRDAWSRLRDSSPLTLSEEELAGLRGLGDQIDLAEVAAIYQPLSRLLSLYVGATRGLRYAMGTFLGETPARTPFVIGISGSVAVGKSTTARILKALIARWPDEPTVELVTTDGFLLPNAELERRRILGRKGFPESYDQRALLRFVADVKAGKPEASVPVYSHLVYDILPGEQIVVQQPDVLLLEGLNVLQPAFPRPDGRPRLSVSDFFDFSVYVDARVEDVRDWFVERFLTLRATAFQDEASFFHRFASLTHDEAVAFALEVWRDINEVNLVENILPTRGRATLVLRKDADHSIGRVRLRKL